MFFLVLLCIPVHPVYASSSNGAFSPTISIQQFERSEEGNIQVKIKCQQTSSTPASPTYTMLYVKMSEGSLNGCTAKIVDENGTVHNSVFQQTSENLWRLDNVATCYRYNRPLYVSFTFNCLKSIHFEAKYSISDGGAITENSDTESKDIVNPVLSVQSVPQNLNLGERLDPDKCVTNIKYGGEPIDNSRCAIYFKEESEKDLIDNVSLKSRTVVVEFEGLQTDVNVPLNITFGNSLVLYGYNADGEKTICACPLLNGKVTAFSGNHELSNLPVNPSYGNKLYCSVDVHSFLKTSVVSDKSQYHLEVKGTDKQDQCIKSWKWRRVTSGDVVKVYHSNPDFNNYYCKNEKLNATEGKQEVYYRIEGSSYIPMDINKVKLRSITVPFNASKEYLDQHGSDLIDNPQHLNFSFSKFISYPDTTSSGEKPCVIEIKEPTASGKYALFHYNVNVTVQEELSLEIPSMLNFKKVKNSSNQQIIQRESMDKDIVIHNARQTQNNWKLMLSASKSEIGSYCVFRRENGAEVSLKEPVCIFKADVSKLDSDEINISKSWKENTGLLLDIPPKTFISPGSYFLQLNWNIVKGP